MVTKKINAEALRAIVKEAIVDHKKKKMSASDKRIKTEKDKEKSQAKKDENLNENVALNSEQLRAYIKEAISKQISEMMASDTSSKPKVSVPRPPASMMPSEPEAEAPSTSRAPQEGDKVQLASGKEAWVAKVSGDMVFVTLDGVKMVGVPMEYVSVLDDSSGFEASRAPDESPESRKGTLDGYLDRLSIGKDTRSKLDAERASLDESKKKNK